MSPQVAQDIEDRKYDQVIKLIQKLGVFIMLSNKGDDLPATNENYETLVSAATTLEQYAAIEHNQFLMESKRKWEEEHCWCGEKIDVEGFCPKWTYAPVRNSHREGSKGG